MPRKKWAVNSRQYFPSVDEMYKSRLNLFLARARCQVYNKDHAIDAVHDALIKTIKYFNKYTDKKVRAQVMLWNIDKACKKINKYSKEIPYGLFKESFDVED